MASFFQNCHRCYCFTKVQQFSFIILRFILISSDHPSVTAPPFTQSFLRQSAPLPAIPTMAAPNDSQMGCSFFSNNTGAIDSVTCNPSYGNRTATDFSGTQQNAHANNNTNHYNMNQPNAPTVNPPVQQVRGPPNVPLPPLPDNSDDLTMAFSKFKI